MTFKNDDVSCDGEGAVYFMLAILWIIFGWVPWAIFLVSYMAFIGAETISGTDPLNITAFVLSYAFAPLWALIIYRLSYMENLRVSFQNQQMDY